jgi:hypothetical protein
MEEAIRHYSVARALRPELGFELGAFLRLEGHPSEAVAVLQGLVRRRPDVARFRTELAVALRERGEAAEADAALNDAVAVARREVGLRPDDDVARHDLAFALRVLGRRDEALAEYREVVRLRPDEGGWHWNLAEFLHSLGRYSEALVEYREETRLGPDAPDTRERIRECERLIRFGERLPAYLEGTDRPADPQERLELATFCYRKDLFRAAARFAAEAFAAKPALAEDLVSEARYNAACEATLAGSGRGRDDPPPDEAARADLRRQALDWLRSDLAAWAKLQKEWPAGAPQKIGRTLRHWKHDPDLAGLRDEGELAKLPPAEREACRKLWGEVDRLLRVAADPADTAE